MSTLRGEPASQFQSECSVSGLGWLSVFIWSNLNWLSPRKYYSPVIVILLT